MYDLGAFVSVLIPGRDVLKRKPEIGRILSVGGVQANLQACERKLMNCELSVRTENTLDRDLCMNPDVPTDGLVEAECWEHGSPRLVETIVEKFQLGQSVGMIAAQRIRRIHPESQRQAFGRRN